MARGQSKEYANFYNGQALEAEILRMEGWSGDADCHDGWVSSSAFAPTREEFGIPKPDIPDDNGEPAEIDHDAALDAEIEAAADVCVENDMIAGEVDAIEEVCVDDVEDATEISQANQSPQEVCVDDVEEATDISRANQSPQEAVALSLAGSTQWLCQYLGRKRHMAQVNGKEEWTHFGNNFSKVPGLQAPPPTQNEHEHTAIIQAPHETLVQAPLPPRKRRKKKPGEPTSKHR